MKAKQFFKSSWLVSAFVLVIIVAELAAWTVASYIGFRNHPLVVAFLAAGLVAAIASVLYEGEDLG